MVVHGKLHLLVPNTFQASSVYSNETGLAIGVVVGVTANPRYEILEVQLL